MGGTLQNGHSRMYLGGEGRSFCARGGGGSKVRFHGQSGAKLVDHRCGGGVFWMMLELLHKDTKTGKEGQNVS